MKATITFPWSNIEYCDRCEKKDVGFICSEVEKEMNTPTRSFNHCNKMLCEICWNEHFNDEVNE